MPLCDVVVIVMCVCVIVVLKGSGHCRNPSWNKGSDSELLEYSVNAGVQSTLQVRADLTQASASCLYVLIH